MSAERSQPCSLQHVCADLKSTSGYVGALFKLVATLLQAKGCESIDGGIQSYCKVYL